MLVGEHRIRHQFVDGVAEVFGVPYYRVMVALGPSGASRDRLNLAVGAIENLELKGFVVGLARFRRRLI